MYKLKLHFSTTLNRNLIFFVSHHSIHVRNLYHWNAIYTHTIWRLITIYLFNIIIIAHIYHIALLQDNTLWLYLPLYIHVELSLVYMKVLCVEWINKHIISLRLWNHWINKKLESWKTMMLWSSSWINVSNTAIKQQIIFSLTSLSQ